MHSILEAIHLNLTKMVETYTARNMFVFKQETKIHRILRRDFLRSDMLNKTITLPAASAGF